jgi:hypothetical protein
LSPVIAWPLSLLEENRRYESFTLTVTSADRGLQGHERRNPIPASGREVVVVSNGYMGVRGDITVSVHNVHAEKNDNSGIQLGSHSSRSGAMARGLDAFPALLKGPPA